MGAHRAARRGFPINGERNAKRSKYEGNAMSDFLARMKSAAKADKKTIVLPEGEDPRTIEAAKKIVEEGLANLVILGNPDEIQIDGVTVIDPRTAEKKQAYAEKFAELRAKKGVTLPEALEQMNDATYFGTMMVKMGDADGLVSGAGRPSCLARSRRWPCSPSPRWAPPRATCPPRSRRP